jgi:hypothetical protein
VTPKTGPNSASCLFWDKFSSSKSFRKQWNGKTSYLSSFGLDGNWVFHAADSIREYSFLGLDDVGAIDLSAIFSFGDVRLDLVVRCDFGDTVR